MKKQFNKKVFLTKFVLILFLGIVLGASCLFSDKIELALGIGSKSSSISAKEEIVDGLKIHYLDVGQGDCTFIEFPDDTTMMIDSSIASYSEHIIEYVQDLGVTQIDYFVLTHSDNDHVGGAKAVFEAFEIKNVYRPFQVAVKSKTDQTPIDEEPLDSYVSCSSVAWTASYLNFIRATYTETYTENGLQHEALVYVSNDGMKIESTKEGCEFVFEFFGPLVDNSLDYFLETEKTIGRPTKNYGNANDSSPVMLLEYKEKSFLFTGDASETVEKDVISSLDTDEKERFKNVDVMQAGHHGSKTSNSEELLTLSTPNFFVVSAGKDNRYNHPNDETIERVKSYVHSASDYLLITYESGDILFGFNSDGDLIYFANVGGSGVTIYYWEIALAIFVVGVIVILSVKVTKNKKATAKRVVSQTKKTVKNLEKQNKKY